jgi:hypothetical protein
MSIERAIMAIHGLLVEPIHPNRSHKFRFPSYKEAKRKIKSMKGEKFKIRRNG